MQITAHTPTVLVMGNEIHRSRLDEKALNAEVTPYWRVSVVDVTSSTQYDLAHKENLINGDVIVAEFQSAGRGRLDRTFSAPESSALLFSFFVETFRTKEDWGWIPLLAVQSLRSSLAELDPTIDITLKWPNDLLIGDLKVAGLLCEAHSNGVIVGIGLNVTITEDELPVPTATSLELSDFAQLDRNKILAHFLKRFRRDFNIWQEMGSAPFIDDYRRHSSTIGREIRAIRPSGEIVEARALDISPDGELLLEHSVVVSVGDVIHLR
jgi:BirA family biotin operon repressor/biotin-[acetyl-CoA-carboxylase] ligase